ncbi:hypothetical protein EJB05_56587, partial [Eragrostis curvula]
MRRRIGAPRQCVQRGAAGLGSATVEGPGPRREVGASAGLFLGTGAVSGLNLLLCLATFVYHARYELRVQGVSAPRGTLLERLRAWLHHYDVKDLGSPTFKEWIDGSMRSGRDAGGASGGSNRHDTIQRLCWLLSSVHSVRQEITIKADDINNAAEEIISFLKDTGKSVIYFDGWGGLGASSALKAVVKLLRSSSSQREDAIGNPNLDKIIHIDCSRWQSKRALQKAIAEELKLPQQVMAIFDQHDKEDDFYGVEEGARGVIQDAKMAILNDLAKITFLAVFHNGSGVYIDLQEYGIPISGLLSKTVLWTSRGRFRLHTRQEDVKKLAMSSEVAISADVSSDSTVYTVERLLHAEAEDVARYTGVPEPDMNPKVVTECFLYTVLRGEEYGIDWGIHAANYWVCDGIIQNSTNADRSAWEIADALQRNMSIPMDWHHIWLVNIRDVLGLSGKKWKCCDRWISANRRQRQQQHEDTNYCDATSVQVPPQATSFFWIAQGQSNKKNSTAILEAGMFGHSNSSSLRVIHLSQCTFSFSSPPFSSCSSLRFLLLHQCKDKDAGVATDCSGEKVHDHYRQNNHGSGACFRKLWVLELSYTDWYWLLSEGMMDLMAELRELNVKGVKNWSINNLNRGSGAESNSCRLPNLVILRVTSQPTDVDSSDKNQASPLVAFPDLSSSIILKKVVLDGCVELEELGFNVLPPSLESFSFTSNVNTNIKSMCFRGCTKLEYVLLKGLFRNLVELDMSGTAIRSLDLSATEAPKLKHLFLFGCEKLCAILWPQYGRKPKLEELHIDTTQAALTKEHKSTKEPRDDTIVGSSAVVLGCSRAPPEFDFYIMLRDARVFRSLSHAGVNNRLHIEITTDAASYIGGHKGISQGTNSSTSRCERQVRALSLQKPAGNLYADNIAATFKDNSQDVTAMWPCPSAPPCKGRCFISTQETRIELPHVTARTEQGTRATILPNFVHERAEALHLHDSFSITCIPGPAPATIDLKWDLLMWCRLERCPNLEGTVFTAPARGESLIFYWLRTFWASQLLKALYIWDWSASSFRPRYRSFEDLRFLHIDCCPRLIHVLPLCASNRRGCHSLKTLEIVYCGNLKEVFPLDHSDSEEQEEPPREFPCLERIHLHELPKLQRVCGRRMYTPNLKTVKIRGCWNLKRLPALRRSGNNPPPKVDCEREWWNGLEWDGEELTGHHPTLYKASHSQYDKKTLLRTSVLR